LLLGIVTRVQAKEETLLNPITRNKRPIEVPKYSFAPNALNGVRGGGVVEITRRLTVNQKTLSEFLGWLPSPYVPMAGFLYLGQTNPNA